MTEFERRIHQSAISIDNLIEEADECNLDLKKGVDHYSDEMEKLNLEK